MAKIKVSQKTIDSIKKMGMTEALKLAGKNGNPAGGMASEFQEGIRRMYGANRLAAAKTKYSPVKAKSADAARAGASKVAATKPAAKPVAKSNTKSNVVKATIGGAAALGVLAATKGKGASAAAKLSPGLAKSAIGKALVGKTPTMSPSALAKFKASQGAKAAPAKVTVGPKGSFGPTTKSMAKSKMGTASEYATKAGQEQARAAIKAKSPDAARATVAKKTAKKAVASVSKKKIAKAGIASSGAGQTRK